MQFTTEELGSGSFAVATEHFHHRVFSLYLMLFGNIDFIPINNLVGTSGHFAYTEISDIAVVQETNPTHLPLMLVDLSLD